MASSSSRYSVKEPLVDADYRRWCIYKVPPKLRELNVDMFTPRQVSIGPFYHGHPSLNDFQEIKSVYLDHFLRRVSTSISLNGLINFVQEIEPSVRCCYSRTTLSLFFCPTSPHNVELSREEFVNVILTDSCFIFELFLRFYNDDWPQGDPVLSKTGRFEALRGDLVLVENQLPFFVLEKLFELAVPPHHSLPSFLQLSFHFFSCFNTLKSDPADVRIIHFTDLVRTFFLQPLSGRRWPARGDSHWVRLQSATELAEAGIKFKKSTSPCFMDLKYSGGVLEIPQLEVDCWSETLAYNLVALEQWHYLSQAYISDYVYILRHLLKTREDVDLLFENGVMLGCNRAAYYLANAIDGLARNAYGEFDCNFNSDYSELCKDLNTFCRHPWTRMKVTLRRQYCDLRLNAISVAAILLLILSPTQTDLAGFYFIAAGALVRLLKPAGRLGTFGTLLMIWGIVKKLILGAPVNSGISAYGYPTLLIAFICYVMR